MSWVQCVAIRIYPRAPLQLTVRHFVDTVQRYVCGITSQIPDYAGDGTDQAQPIFRL